MKNLKNERGIGLLPFILIFVGILVVAGIIVGGIVINKNLNKEPMTVSEFKDIMEDKDFEIIDAIDQVDDYDNNIKKAYIALEEDYAYQIEFYRLDEEEDAIYFYNTNKEIFENSKSSSSAETSVSMGNNSKYTLTSGDKYKVVSRIENTVIYLDVDEEYKDEIKEILKEIGY